MSKLCINIVMYFLVHRITGNTQNTPQQYLSHCYICLCLIYLNGIDAPNHYITHQSAFAFMSERACYSRVAIDAVLFCKNTMRPFVL